jgi:hypothetical protein
MCLLQSHHCNLPSMITLCACSSFRMTVKQHKQHSRVVERLLLQCL